MMRGRSCISQRLRSMMLSDVLFFFAVFFLFLSTTSRGPAAGGGIASHVLRTEPALLAVSAQRARPLASARSACCCPRAVRAGGEK